jgi:CBS domain-containing protein
MLRVRDIMTADVLTLAPGTTLREAVRQLTAHRVGGAPVVFGGRVLGVLSASDVLAFVLAPSGGAPAAGAPVEGPYAEEALALPELPEGAEVPAAFFIEPWDDTGERTAEPPGAATQGRDVLDDHTVADAMSRRVYALPPDAAVDRAASYMQSAGVHRLLVVDDERLVGIVSALDVARAVADHQLTVHTFVFNRDDDFDPRGFA